MAEIHVKGLSDLQKFLDQLPAKLERNIMRSALRAGANVLKAQALANVPVKSGDLRRSLKVGTNARGGVVTATVRTKLFYARFVEYGTKAHNIKARRAKALHVAAWFGLSVSHPGSRPRPFLRPALDVAAGAAVIAVGEQVKARLTKTGLDASPVRVEGDE